MLSDLAMRKRTPPSSSPALDGPHNTSSGARRRRLHKTPTPDVARGTLADSEPKFYLGSKFFQGLEN